MATASPGTDTLAVARWGDGEDGSKSDRYLAERLAAAGADVKGVAVATFVLAAAVGTLLWLAVGVAADHWLFVGGVPAWARWCWLGVGLVALTAAIVRWIVPLVRYRVNLVFAARAIERDYPELHNDLVNTVLVKARPDATVAPVVRSLERRAAKRLAHVPTDGVIDRTTTLRLALALAALVVAATLYGLLAPKSLLTTAARLVAPWARITPPTRVAIDTPRLAWRRPGEPPDEVNHVTRELQAADGVVRVVRGRQLVVSATVRGLRGDERPTLVVRPTEGGDRGWDAVMAAGTAGPGGQERHVAVLPDDVRGLEDPLDVVIAAGDARTEPLRIDVVDTPSLLVREVRYEYPAYTARAPETVAWQGDLRAVEGTTVAIVAEANGPLEAAWIDFDCDGTNDLELSVGRQEPHRATGRFRLRLDADRARPWHETYRLVFVPGGSGGTRADPITEHIEYRIEVLPDLAPEVTIESPREPVVAVPPDAPVAIAVRALDPDFGLARVAIELRLKGEPPLPARPLLEEPRGGPFRGTTRLVPREIGAGPGAAIEYRAVAIDTRPEEPNVAATRWQTLRVDATAPPPRQPDVPPAGAERPREESPRTDGKPSERPADVPRRDDARDDRRDKPDDTPQNTPQDSARGGPREEPRDGPKDDRKDAGTSADGQPGAPRPAASAPDTVNDGAERPQDGAASREPGGARQRDEQRRPGAEPDAAPPPGGQPQRGDTPPGQPDATGDPQQGGGQERGGSASKGERAADGQRGQTGERSEDRGALAADGTNDGEAMERILEHKKREERGRQGEAPREPSTGRDGKADDARQPDEGQSGAGAQSQRGGREGGEQGSPTPGQQGGAGGEDRSDMKRPSAETGGREPGQAGDGRPGPQGEAKPGEGKPGEGKAGEGQPEQGNPGAGQAGAGRPDNAGQGPQGEAKPGEGKRGEGQPGQGKPGADDGQRGGVTPDQAQPGEAGSAQSGQGRPGEGKSDAARPGDPGQGTPGAGKRGEGRPGKGEHEEGQAGEGKPGADDGQGGAGKPGQGQRGEGKSAEGRPGADDGQPGVGTPDERQPREGGAGEGKQGEGQPSDGQGGQGQGKPAQGRSGEDRPDRGQPGQGKPGEGKPGEGKPGEGKPGEGKPGEGKPGEGKPGEGKPGEGQGATPAGTEPAGSSVGAGGTTGGNRGEGPAATADSAAPERREMEWTDTDLSHARNAADLALEHLRKNVAAGRTDVLDRLGWTPEQARAFLERWQEMRRLADSPDPRQRGEFERTLRSLGLRPEGVRSSRDAPSDTKGGQAEGRRSRPPSSYREQFEAYLRGTAGE
jgi:hypothetical protein